MLIKVVNKDTGKDVSVNLDLKDNLKQVREILSSQDLMEDQTMFIFQNAPVMQCYEERVSLEELLKDHPVLEIGRTGEIDPALQTNDFTSLTEGEILNYFKKKQLLRGLIFSKKDGIKKSFSDVFTLSYAPEMSMESENTYFHSYYAFSKESCDLSLLTSNKSSLALNTPFVDTSAEYTSQKSSKTHSETVTEYLLSKYVVSLISFQIDPDKCIPVRNFAEKINTIITANMDQERKMVKLLEVLEEFGLYIPIEFTMGGAMYATESTEIRDLSMAESNMEDFSSQANAAFDGYGGNLSFSSGSESSSGSSSTTKFKDIEIKQIGGEAGNTENKEFFRASLKSAANWAMVDVAKFYPTVLLLANAEEFPGMDPLLFVKTKKLMMDFSMHKFVLESQPYINMQRYIDVVEEAFSIL